LTATCDSNDHEESTWTPRNLIKEEQEIGNWNRIKRNVEKLNTDNNVDELTISKDDLKGFRCKTLNRF